MRAILRVADKRYRPKFNRWQRCTERVRQSSPFESMSVRRAFMTRHVGPLLAALLLAGCASMTPTAPKASATLAATAGNKAAGSVAFTPNGDRVRVLATLTGLAPGAHGFHIHEKGDCSAPDGMSAGGHFNPTGKAHGNPSAGEHHGGDMPMLVADAAGNATLDVTLDTVTLGAGANSIVGRAVIVHKDPDDFKTQPTGNSGARVACGVIAAA
jgi:Cu-Zn family superoxide dismutase